LLSKQTAAETKFYAELQKTMIKKKEQIPYPRCGLEVGLRCE
jgi:hypothetical protein